MLSRVSDNNLVRNHKSLKNFSYVLPGYKNEHRQPSFIPMESSGEAQWAKTSFAILIDFRPSQTSSERYVQVGTPLESHT